VEEAIVDAYGDSEQLVGFLTMLEENLACPFTTTILALPFGSNASASTPPTRSWPSVAADNSDR
jgi:hypothetical protein